MLTDTEILSQLFADNAKIAVQTDTYNKTFITLTEPQCPDHSVVIHGIPREALVIKVDSFKSPDTIFKGDKGECKRADYIIISEQHILHIEMKRTRGLKKEIVKQLSGSKCFIHYCQEIAAAFWGKRDFLKHHKSRYVSFGHISIDKHRTKIEPPTEGRHDTPEKVMKINWPRKSQFNYLVGNPP